MLAFLRRQADEGVVRVAVFKLLVAGPPAQGKTSLLQRLRETAEASALEEAVQAWAPLATETTDGVDIAMAALCLDGGSAAGAGDGGEAPAVEARTWDCGGQVVYKHTNRIFFSRDRTVYAAVYSLRTQITTEFKDALHDVRCYAPDAPVVLVGTHQDNKEEDPAAVEELLANVSSAAPSQA